jgi:putative colanic acid biosynthesis UDP-glucose lipid carrier transferase
MNNSKISLRISDLVIALFFLILLSPVFLIISLLILILDGRPIFFVQSRTGLNFHPFTIFKFRTLKNSSLQTFSQVQIGDPRLYDFGSFLRKTSLDELPQLVNVIKGDMSMVGPRPHVIDLDLQFMDAIPDYRKRNTVKPGVTGLAQVRGHRGPTQSHRIMARRIKLDILFIESRSLRLYFIILIKTFRVVIRDVKAF